MGPPKKAPPSGCIKKYFRQKLADFLRVSLIITRAQKVAIFFQRLSFVTKLVNAPLSKK
jgi:hypothetical protein